MSMEMVAIIRSNYHVVCCDDPQCGGHYKLIDLLLSPIDTTRCPSFVLTWTSFFKPFHMTFCVSWMALRNESILKHVFKSSRFVQSPIVVTWIFIWKRLNWARTHARTQQHWTEEMCAKNHLIQLTRVLSVHTLWLNAIITCCEPEVSYTQRMRWCALFAHTNTHIRIW